MRPLTENETRLLFEKLAKFKKLLKYANRIGRDRLCSIGICMAKFTHSGQIHLTITGLDYLYQFAETKVWVKSKNEMGFLYGNHVLKSGVRKMTQNTQKHQGVVVCSPNDVPLGFGITAKSVEESRISKPTDVLVLNQHDTGFYLRKENTSSIFG